MALLLGVALKSRLAAISGWPFPVPAWDCRRSTWASWPQPAARSVCRASSARSSFTLPIDEALKMDERVVQELMAGSQSRALRHLFFAEREAAKIPGLPPSAKARDIDTAVIVGAGTMGGGIAMSFANAGIPV